MAISKKDDEHTQGPPEYFPDLYPPKPVPKPAMSVSFEYALGQSVEVESLGITGTIVAAAVWFTDQTVVYLLATGPDQEQQWYPQMMISPIRLYEHEDEKGT